MLRSSFLHHHYRPGDGAGQSLRIGEAGLDYEGALGRKGVAEAPRGEAGGRGLPHEGISEDVTYEPFVPS